MKGSWDFFTPLNAENYGSVRMVNYAGGTNPDQTLSLSVPKGKKNVSLMLFFHGGGMTGGQREFPAGIYNGEFAVAESRYRLSPAAPAPAQIEDAAQAIAWCLAHAEEYGIDPRKIFIGGMSAGAYLAAISVMNPVFLNKYGFHYKDVAGLALISGQMTTHFRVKADLGRNNGPYCPLIDEYAPLNFLAPDLPPILMITGGSGFDMPARPEENAFMAASLQAVGHPFVRCYALPEHSHVGSLESCDFLLMKFLHEVLDNKCQVKNK